MAEVKISNLPDAGDVQQGDTVILVRGGVTQRSTQDPSVSSSSMAGHAGDIIVINPAEDGFDFAILPTLVDTQQISQTWNRGGNTSVGSMLRIGDLDEMLLAYNVALVAMSILRTDTDAATLGVLNNGTPIKTLATSSLTVIDNFAGIACLAGDIISVRNEAGGNTVSNCSVTLTFVRT